MKSLTLCFTQSNCHPTSPPINSNEIFPTKRSFLNQAHLAGTPWYSLYYPSWSDMDSKHSQVVLGLEFRCFPGSNPRCPLPLAWALLLPFEFLTGAKHQLFWKHYPKKNATGSTWASLVTESLKTQGKNHRALSNKLGYKVLWEWKPDNVCESKL